MTADSIRTWDTHSENPFEVLDSYVRAATSNRYDKVFEPAAAPVISSDNMMVTQDSDGRIITETEDETREAEVVLEYKADKTQKYYVFVEAAGAEEILVDVSDEEKDQLGIRSDCGSIVNIGEIKAGETFDITVSFEEGQSLSLIHIYNMALAERVCDRIISLPEINGGE